MNYAKPAIYALPSFIYVRANSPQEAYAHKANVEKLLANPLIKSILAGQGIVLEGFLVQDPVEAPSR